MIDTLTPQADGSIARQTYPVIWQHEDGRRIEIYPDYKRRFGYRVQDPWAVLQRSQVPTLTDAEWFAVPCDAAGWRRV